MAIERIRVSEGSSKTNTFTLRDNAGTVVPLTGVTTAQVTEFDMDTYEPSSSPAVGIINGRQSQDVMNANDVTIHATSGLVTWTIQPDDAVIVTPRRQIERHKWVFRFVVGGAELNYPFEIEVLNLRQGA